MNHIMQHDHQQMADALFLGVRELSVFSKTTRKAGDFSRVRVPARPPFVFSRLAGVVPQISTHGVPLLRHGCSRRKRDVRLIHANISGLNVEGFLNDGARPLIA